MTSWNPGDQQSGQPGYGQQPGQQPPPPNFDKPNTPPPAAPPAYGAPASQPSYGQQQPSYGQQPPAYGAGGYSSPPTSQYGNSPYGAPQGGGNLPPGAVGPLSMGNRVIAFIIDYAIIWVVGAIGYGVLLFGVIGAASTCGYDYDSNGYPVNYSCSGGAGAGLVILALVFLLAWLALCLFWVYMLGKTGQTPGKKWMGVKVVDNDSGQTIGFGRAFLRYIVQGLSNIVCYAGLWSAWLDSPPEGRYRGWHDKAVNSVVISVK